MARVKMDIICSECGNSFVHINICRNRKDAESYEAWAINNITVCPTCYAKQKFINKFAEVAALLDKFSYSLPDIYGVSAKQIAYAESVRNRYLANHMPQIECFLSAIQTLKDADNFAKFDKSCAERGLTADEGFLEYLHGWGLMSVQTMLTSTSAHDILDCKH